MIGVELEDPRLARSVVNGMRDRGVLIGRTGRHDDVLKIRPPLVFEEDHAGLLAEALDESL
jgi:4-aminobutyrate aminotransferase-like enzyme